jgi:hypothetical protein
MAKRREDAVSKLKGLVESLGTKGKDVLKVSASVVKAIGEVVSAEGTKSEAASEMKGVMDRVEGVYGLNKQALKALVKISKMNDAKKSDYLRTFLPGVEALLPSQLDLFADTAPTTQETVEAGEQAGTPGAPSGAPLQ